MIDGYVSRIGGIISADMAVPDHEGEVRFYSRVLTTGDNPLWGEDLMNNLGMPIIGLGPMSPEYEHLPRQWMVHIQVADVATSVERAVALGGRELLHGKDDDGNSQWAGLADPNGAAFGIMPVVPAEAMPKFEGDLAKAGRIAWVDLTVPDAASTRDFYQQVVGWTPQDVAMTDGADDYADYNMLGADGKPAAGVCHARGVNSSLPPVWLIYLPVGDLSESLSRVRDGGGKVVSESGGIAVIQDPAGVFLALAQG